MCSGTKRSSGYVAAGGTGAESVDAADLQTPFVNRNQMACVTLVDKGVQDDGHPPRVLGQQEVAERLRRALREAVGDDGERRVLDPPHAAKRRASRSATMMSEGESGG